MTREFPAQRTSDAEMFSFDDVIMLPAEVFSCLGDTSTVQFAGSTSVPTVVPCVCPL